VRAKEICGGGTAAPHERAAALGGDADEPCCGENIEEAATVFDLHWTRGLQVPHGRDHDPAQRPWLRRAEDGHEVRLLRQQDTTGSERRHHAPERGPLVGQPFDQP
jgi:hypothetical protein